MSNDLDSNIKIEKENEKKPKSFYEIILKMKNNINVNYEDFDFQKGETSPRLLFKKRKNDSNIYDNIRTINFDTKDNVNLSLSSSGVKDQNSNISEEIKNGNKIKHNFENYLEYVHDSYFNEGTNNNNIQGDEFNISTNNFKFSSLDLLVNPLREKFIWETWSPYEVALFECCVCKFNLNFDFYGKLVINIFKFLD